MCTFKLLYNEGTRVFWIHDPGPTGCFPISYIYNAPNPNLDANGYVKPQNELAQDFNKQLISSKTKYFKMRTKLPLVRFTYVDVYTAKYEQISNSRNQGDLTTTYVIFRNIFPPNTN